MLSRLVVQTISHVSALHAPLQRSTALNPRPLCLSPGVLLNKQSSRGAHWTPLHASMAASSAATVRSGAIVVYVTVPSQEAADTLSSGLVEQRLAACVNIVPGLTSVYRWEGKVQRDQELLLMIKSRTSLLSQLTVWVKANHPYAECEVIALPITGGSPSYIQWIIDSTANVEVKA